MKSRKISLIHSILETSNILAKSMSRLFPLLPSLECSQPYVFRFRKIMCADFAHLYI